MDITDCHTHLLPGRLAQKVRAFFDERIGDNMVYPLEHAVILNELRRVGIGTVWSLPYAHRPGVASGLNASSLATMQEYATGPVKVIGGATVHPGDEQPGQIVQTALESGLQVLKLHCSVGNYDADDPLFKPVWEVVQAARMPTIVHVGKAVTGHAHPHELAPIARVAAQYPDAPLVIAHCAYPASAQVFDLLETYPNVYADLTPVVFDLITFPVERLNKVSDKLLFGSDAPNVGIRVEKQLAHLRNLNLDPATEAAILVGNASRLLRMKDE